MAEVGVRELKARLSEHLRRAQGGERLAQLVAEGRVRYGGGSPLGLEPRVRLKGDTSVSKAIIEDRR